MGDRISLRVPFTKQKVNLPTEFYITREEFSAVMLVGLAEELERNIYWVTDVLGIIVFLEQLRRRMQ